MELRESKCDLNLSCRIIQKIRRKYSKIYEINGKKA